MAFSAYLDTVDMRLKSARDRKAQYLDAVILIKTYWENRIKRYPPASAGVLSSKLQQFIDELKATLEKDTGQIVTYEEGMLVLSLDQELITFIDAKSFWPQNTIALIATPEGIRLVVSELPG